MANFICTTCGTQFDDTHEPPNICPICSDERQYVNPTGQQWITLEQLKRKHKIVIQKKENNLYGIGITPGFGIGQRALLVKTSEGNLLWDCISLIDEAAVDFINGLGGLDAIAISHPHYYTSMVEWSRAFGNVPLYIHEKDKQWVQRPDKSVAYWNDKSKTLFNGLTLFNLGGHFAGGTILHWSEGANGKGALLTGDILQVVPDRKHVSFMYSYPNHIPLNRQAIDHITSVLDPLEFDRIYGAWWDQNILENAKRSVRTSAARYIEAIS
jgi:glyoxylase-like metal-dependent hydrolase (beta-lactamase superfamily II)